MDDSKVLEKEAQVLQAAAHKLVIKLYEVIDSASHLFIVMELAGGGRMPSERMAEEVRIDCHYFTCCTVDVNTCKVLPFCVSVN